MSVLTQVEVEGDKLSELELELFFLLLTVAGNETTRNLISGAMHTFFRTPTSGTKLRDDRSLMPKAVEEMLRYVTPVMNFRRQTTQADRAAGPEDRGRPEGRLLPHLGQPRRGRLREPPGLRHLPVAQPPHGLRRGRAPLLPGGQPGPDGDPGDVRAPPRPDARHATRTATSSGSSRRSSTASSTSPSPSPPAPPSGAETRPRRSPRTRTGNRATACASTRR